MSITLAGDEDETVFYRVLVVDLVMRCHSAKHAERLIGIGVSNTLENMTLS